MSTATCRYCGAEILFVETVRGMQMPLDPRPNDKGNIVIERAGTTRGPLGLLRAVVVRPDERVGEPRWITHLATCPKRPERRRRRGKAGMRRVPAVAGA